MSAVMSSVTPLRVALVGAEGETDEVDNLETLKLMESVYRATGVEIPA
jgi:hypothetical protein